MKHWTREHTLDAFGRPTRMYGVRIAAQGDVIGVVCATTSDGMHFFGAPVLERHLTPAQSLDHATPFALPAIQIREGVEIPPRFDFPTALDCVSVMLHYERANGQGYTLLDFHGVRFDPAMVDDIHAQ